MRTAVIDIGSDAIQLVVLEADGMGSQCVLAREQIPVALGKGLLRAGRISPESFQAGLQALTQIAGLQRSFQCGSVQAIGAATLRDASNATHFLEESEKLGIPVQILSCDEEARLLYQAARHAISLPMEPTVLLDVQGGSTILTWLAGARITASIALPWGPQNLAEALPTEDPPSADDVKRVTRFIRKAVKSSLRRLPERLPRPALVLGTSARLLNLARLAGSGPELTLEQLGRFHRKTWRMSLQERTGWPGVDPWQAGSLHVDAAWSLGLLEGLEVQHLRCLPVGRREGLLREALKQGGSDRSTAAGRRRASVEALAARLDPDPDHSQQVRRLAGQLFEDLRSTLGLGDQERESLAAAARLHGIGLSVAAKDHHKHGAALVQNEDLDGFRSQDIELLSHLVRFHRGKAPDAARHADFARLAPWHRATVEKLAAILRAANALDRGHRQAVQTVRIEFRREECRMHLQGQGDLHLELEAFQEMGALLFRLLDRPVRLVVSERLPERPDTLVGCRFPN